MRRPYWIPFNAPVTDFPPVEHALSYPDGLLAIGGDLQPERIIAAYERGIFPWYSEEQPILWWSPDPRMVLFPEELRVTRSLRKNIRNGGFHVTLNRAFEAVVEYCASTPRQDQDGTWLLPEMREAYQQLHQRGIAHSVECWHRGQLVGGLYGLGLGRVFFGESMFSRRSNASKVAFAVFVRRLQAWGYEMIDCQVYTEHLESLGAQPIPRKNFIHLLKLWCALPPARALPSLALNLSEQEADAI